MFGFGKAAQQSARTAQASSARKPRTGGYDPHRTNGPDTPVLDRNRLARALDHAAWRDPSVQSRRDSQIRAALMVLERTAACTDLAIERLDEAASAVEAGGCATSPVMRGLLATRTDEVLDSLERIALMAGEGGVNLLDGGIQGLKLQLDAGGMHYALGPVSLRRDGRGFNIPTCDTAFEDPAETNAIAQAIQRARVRLAQYADRLTHDAVTLSRLIGALPPAPVEASGAAIAPEPARTDVLELDADMAVAAAAAGSGAQDTQSDPGLAA